ncbi:MAG: hypothetical protein C4329_04030 [Chitinophagaceae bacterium]
MVSVAHFTFNETWTIPGTCGRADVVYSRTIVVNCCVYCTYTQGFYGNRNGLALLNTSGGILSTNLVIGTGPKSVLIPAGSGTILNGMMPGGGTAGPLTVMGQCNITTSCFNAYLTRQNRINNVLLSQTITLALNAILRGGALAGLSLGQGCIVTSGGTININQNVMNYLGNNATVQSLLNLANSVLGGSLTPGVGGVPSYSDVNSAVDAINQGFDECRTFLGYCTEAPVNVARNPVSSEEVEKGTKLAVQAFPNPFNDQVRFVIESPVSGQGTLEVFTTLGQRVQVVYQGFVAAGKGQVIDYKVPVKNRTNLIYVLTINGQRVTGKLLNAKD